ISVPISNQLDQVSFVYSFDVTVQTYANIQFSIWLNSPYLVGNQTIVFAISGANTSGIIELATIPIEPCPTQSATEGCASYINSSQVNGTLGTSSTIRSSIDDFRDPCLSSVSYSTAISVKKIA
ncbi:unnamed protein product, partial [Adineta ricciae]